MDMNKHSKQPFPIFLKTDNALKYFTECFEMLFEFPGRSFNTLLYNKHLYFHLKMLLFEGATMKLRLSNQFFWVFMVL